MKKYTSILSFSVMLLLALTAFKQKKNKFHSEDKWAGNILFRQIIYDTVYGTHVCGWQRDTSWSEWRMQAAIINNKGTTKSSSTGSRRGTSADTCVNVNGTGAIKDTFYANGQAPTELVLSIDEEGKEYDFTVDIPACTGKKISKRWSNGTLEIINDDFSEGDSQILVERYKLGKDRNTLIGRIDKHDHPQKGVEWVQIWEWNLKKIK